MIFIYYLIINYLKKKKKQQQNHYCITDIDFFVYLKIYEISKKNYI